MSEKFRLEPVNDKAQWDSFLSSCSYASIFHKWDWLALMEKHSSSKLYSLVSFKGDEPVALIPFFLQKKGFLRLVFSPPPELGIPKLGPVFLSQGLKQSKFEGIQLSVYDEVLSFLSSELRPNYFQLNALPDINDIRPFKWAGFSVEPMYTYLITLTVGADPIWAGFKKELRKNVSNAKEKGVSVRQGSRDDFDYVLTSNADRYLEQGIFHSSSSTYFQDVFKAFHPDSMQVFVAELNGERIGGLITVSSKDTVSAWIGATKTEMQGIYPNDVLQWESIKWACEKGFKTYEIIGANTPRICRFKAKYNPAPALYYSITSYRPFAIRYLVSLYRFLRGRGQAGAENGDQI